MYCFIYKQQWLQERLSGADTNVTAGQMFKQIRGHHYPSEIPAAEKKTKQKPKKVLLSVIRKIFAKKVDIKCGNCEQKPGLCLAPCFMLYHTAIDCSQK